MLRFTVHCTLYGLNHPEIFTHSPTYTHKSTEPDTESHENHNEKPVLLYLCECVVCIVVGSSKSTVDCAQNFLLQSCRTDERTHLREIVSSLSHDMHTQNDKYALLLLLFASPHELMQTLRSLSFSFLFLFLCLFVGLSELSYTNTVPQYLSHWMLIRCIRQHSKKKYNKRRNESNGIQWMAKMKELQICIKHGRFLTFFSQQILMNFSFSCVVAKILDGWFRFSIDLNLHLMN